MTFAQFNPDHATGGHSNNLFYRFYITGPQGAHFELLKEKHHTAEDVASAKAFLRRNHDVVSIRVIRETVKPTGTRKSLIHH